jgi:choline-sulfatase
MTPSPPNLLVFMTDDHGHWAARCCGNSEIHSPSLDYLAATGARFTSAFTPSPVCSPARASFFSGKIPSAHGIHDWIEELGVGKDHPGLGGQTTLAARLQRSGYLTGLAGKWHLNHFQKKPPGFDVWFTSALGTNACFGDQPFYEDDKLLALHGHQATHLTDRALRFLRDRDRQKPFFLFVGYTNTHTPHSGEPERLAAPYRRARFDDLPDEQPSPVHGWPRFPMPRDPAQRREQLAQYYAAVSMIDEQLGRILDELDNHRELDNTLIVYTSDHGHMNGHHGLHTKGNATVPQNFLEESIRVPLLLRWPSRVTAGQVRTEFVDHCDLFATLLDAAGTDALTDQGDNRRTGRSFLPLLRAQTIPWRDRQCCEYGNARMLRTTSAKLIRRYPGPNGHFPDEFYDLLTDPRETRNAIDQPAHANTIRQLSEQLDAHFQQYENPALSGLGIATLPICNRYQPWTLQPG